MFNGLWPEQTFLAQLCLQYAPSSIMSASHPPSHMESRSIVDPLYADSSFLAERYWRARPEIAVTAGCLMMRSKEMA
jgi:hypothetical protein